MISLLIAFLLFSARSSQDLANVEYKIITTYETLYGTQYSGMVSQNGKITEEVMEPSYPQNYLFKKSEPKTRFRVDSMTSVPLSQIGTYGGFYAAGAAGNDIQVEMKLNEMASQGYQLQFVSSGAGGAENTGILVTKYIFRRSK